MYLNKAIVIGNLTRDPQLSYTPNNTAVCKFGIATNHKWKDRDGNMREEVCFVDCTVFGRGGETFNQYMSKGRSVLIEGRLQLGQWTTPEGEKRSKHAVVVDNFTFVGGGRGGDVGGQTAEAHAGGPVPHAEAAGPGYDSPPPPTDADIPF